MNNFNRDTLGLDNFVDERDLKLLEQDTYTFFVLGRIMKGECNLLLSDHERLIVCFSTQPFPVWIWTPDDATEEELEKVYQLLEAHSMLNGEYKFNVKYELAEFLIGRAKEDGKTLQIQTNMFAYDCLNPVKPNMAADGRMHQCTEADVEELTEFMDLFHHAIDADYESMETYRAKAREGVKYGGYYFWENEEGKRVASCHWHPNGELAAVGMVYTRDEERRKHYAENLVYQVTMIAKEEGYIPMLYTDADYVASNACYEGIGYVLRGKLCTVG